MYPFSRTTFNFSLTLPTNALVVEVYGTEFLGNDSRTKLGWPSRIDAQFSFDHLPKKGLTSPHQSHRVHSQDLVMQSRVALKLSLSFSVCLHSLLYFKFSSFLPLLSLRTLYRHVVNNNFPWHLRFTPNPLRYLKIEDSHYIPHPM